MNNKRMILPVGPARAQSGEAELAALREVQKKMRLQSLSAAMRYAIRNCAKSHGCWPPASPSGEDDNAQD